MENMEKKLGNLKIRIFETYEEMSEEAALFLAGQLKEKPDSSLGFATGSTPIGMYGALCKLNKDNKIDFSKVRATFNLDEYHPIKKTDDQSYYYFMMENLFNHININQSIINIPNGEAADPAAECINYEKAIEAAGGIDFQLLGIGINGHIGFNEPDTSLSAITHYTPLTDETIEANSRFFESFELVPKHAITMGVQTILQAKKILLLCSGEKKAGIIRDTVYGPITTEVPASLLRLHQDVTIMADKAAGKYLCK